MYFATGKIVIILLTIQLFTFYQYKYKNEAYRIKKKHFKQLPRAEQIFWTTLTKNDYKEFDKNERLKLILKHKQNIKNHLLNWSKILYDSFRHKLVTLKERDRTINIPKQYKYEEKKNYKPINNKRQITILEATTVFDQPKFCINEEQVIFHPACPFNNCIWKCSRESTTITQSDASIFHYSDINPERIQTFLEKRSINEIYILWIDEAHKDVHHLDEYKFNWTLSFRQDSEVSIATYGLIIKLEKNKNRQYLNDKTMIPYLSDKQSKFFLNRLHNYSSIPIDKELEFRILINYRFREKQALWFVSNCDPKKRLEYYDHLKKYFTIDARGLCIAESGTNEKEDSLTKQCGKSEQCEKDQMHLSMFYLAFESQSCTDYITEKFWRALHHGMIPIVMGPTKQQYLDLNIPSTAFIHVDDYSSPEQLANRLHAISQNYFEYRKYFLWQVQYAIFYETEDLEPLRMCELCIKLNLNTKHRYYENLNDWHNQEC
ncbi:unnamed protein product [Didymodactylos carnosus]|uniref:Fucosyltransferase n=1 Tax=Didymodactylos carnosus TaxID=1234261 RepID=A0A8S2EDU8_9BILA|nr:unnamed protein product [Didymodactylos carnosus]CAF3950543.1 unnamed protein product [Didymodactylos carnosus]